MRVTAFVLAFACACGGSSSDGTSVDGNGSNVDPTQRYNPWSTGASWSYQISMPGTTKPPAVNKVTTVGALEDVGAPNAGTMAYKVHIQLYTESKDVWETLKGDLDVRYKTAYYDVNNALLETDTVTPYRLHLDESTAHTTTGAQWSETFSETDTKVGMAPATKTETLNWSVVSDAEPITVIAGSYTALHVRRVNPAKAETVDYWYARGVGKLKESGGGTTEELMSFTPGT